MSEVKIENKETDESIRYNLRSTEIYGYHKKLENEKVLAIDAIPPVKIPYNIVYHNDTEAFIELALAGYETKDIVAEIKGNVLYIETAYQYNYEYKSDFVTVDNGSIKRFFNGERNKSLDAHDVDISFYFFRGITSKSFMMKFIIPVDHIFSYAEHKNGLLRFCFKVNQLTEKDIVKIQIDGKN